MGTFVRHISCPNCGSGDAGAEYEDGSAYCFSCAKPIASGEGKPERRPKLDQKFITKASYRDLTDRKIRENICRKYGYMISHIDGVEVHVANYRNDKGEVVAQKLRRPGKEFSIIGDGKMPLYGQHLFAGGKSVVITEGEIDTLAVSQAFDGKWPAVSLPNGAQAAVKAIERAYEWLDGFERIVLCFDGDEPGRKAAQEVAERLPAGKAYIMTLPFKDASETLCKAGTAPIVSAFWSAKEWRPDGIIAGEDISVERLRSAATLGYSLPYPRLNAKLEGLREGELTLLTAGSGIGKSTWAREIAYHLHQTHKLTIGNIFLEESVEKSAQAYVAIHNNKKLSALRADPSILTEEQWASTTQAVIGSRMYFYDHFGSMESERLLAKIRYMRTVLKVHFVILDHISIVISGEKSSTEGERRDIDRLMTSLRSLIEETGVGVIAIVHLNQPEGKPHEEGGRVTLRNLRGSGSLKQLSDNVLALERDQQAEDDSDVSDIRVLKCRETGLVGLADSIAYDHDTGRMKVVETDMDEDTNQPTYGKGTVDDDIPF